MGSVDGVAQGSGARLAVPEWLAEVIRPKKVKPPWGTMLRALLALVVPMAVAFAAGQKDLALLPAMGGLFSVQIDSSGPLWPRVKKIAAAALLGGAPGLLIGTLIHGRGWVAVLAIVVVAGASAVISRLGAIGSMVGLQLFVYSALGLGALGTLRPWWHSALEFLVGVAWALLLLVPGYLLSPRSAERKAVAEVYYVLAQGLRAIGTPGMSGVRPALVAALNTAYDAMLTRRASASGRSQRDMHLMAVLNTSHQFAEAAVALRVTGERVPPLVTDEIELLGDAILHERGPGAGVIGFGGSRSLGGPQLPLIPPVWSDSPGALALREAMLNLTRVLSGTWVAAPLPTARPSLAERSRDRGRFIAEQLIGGRIAWEFTIRLTLCTGIAAVMSEVLPLQRSYWVVLTTGIILKPDYGSVFARAVQRAVGTIIGAVLGAAILAVVPYGPWLLLPFGVLAALLPYAKARSFGLSAVFLTPLVVLLIDLLDVGGWHLAEARLVDTVLASAVVLLVGYAPWPSAWHLYLPGQFAGAVRSVCAYADEALVAMPEARIAATGTARSRDRAPGEAPGTRSRLRRRAYRALSNLRTDFQRMMSEPAAVSRRATAWWPAVVALEEVMDAVTSAAVTIGRDGMVPPSASVTALTGALRSVADAIEVATPPRAPEKLPADLELEGVTTAVRAVLSVVVGNEDGTAPAGGAIPSPVPA